MGVIIRQSVKQSIVSYAAVLIGMVNMLFIYPLTLSKSELGFMQFILSMGSMLIPFVLLGSNNLVTRFFPYFRNQEQKHHGFLVLLISITVSGFAILAGGIWLFRDFFKAQYAEQSGDYLPYLAFILPIALLMSLWTMLSTYSSNFHRIVVPSLLNNLFVKVAVGSTALAYFWGYLTYAYLLNLLVIIHALVVLGLLIYLAFLGQLHWRTDWSFIKPKLRKDMISFAGFSLMSGLGIKLATSIDAYMVGTFIDFENVGVYVIAATIAGAIEIPKRSLAGITAPILADAFKKEDYSKVAMLYEKTATIQFIVGLFIYIGVWTSINLLFALIPNSEEYIAGKYIVLIIGMAKLVDMGTGVVGLIINYSKYFKYDLYFTLFLALFNIITNALLIPIFQINGVALATLASITLWNATKCIFVWNKFKMQPLSWRFPAVIIIALTVYFLANQVPSTGQSILDIIIRSAIVTLLFGGLIIGFRISPDINDAIQDFLRKILRR